MHADARATMKNRFYFSEPGCQECGCPEGEVEVHRTEDDGVKMIARCVGCDDIRVKEITGAELVGLLASVRVNVG